MSPKSIATSLRHAIGVCAGTVFWLLIGPLVGLCTVPLFVLPKQRGMTIARSIIRASFRAYVQLMQCTDLVRVEYQNRHVIQQASAQGFILAPNHMSLWDAVFLLADVPNIVCILKHKLLYNPILGVTARAARYISNIKVSRMLHLACEEIEQGSILLLFPEGTRTLPTAEWLNPLKASIGLVARRTNAAVVPVLLRSNSRYLQKGWPAWNLPTFPVVIEVSYADPILIEEEETAAEFTKRLENFYLTELSQPHSLRRNNYQSACASETCS
jgi:1-acyl-sn-glycerol-3-phosphate acyltransferase